MLGYLSADIICSERRTVFRERSSRETVSFGEQTMSKDKYPSIFSPPNGGYCVYFSSNLFRIARSFENWGMFSNIPQFQLGHIRSRDVFRPIARQWKYLMDYNPRYSTRKRWITRIYMYTLVGLDRTQRPCENNLATLTESKTSVIYMSRNSWNKYRRMYAVLVDVQWIKSCEVICSYNIPL